MERELRPEVAAFERAIRGADARLRDFRTIARQRYDVDVASGVSVAEARERRQAARKAAEALHADDMAAAGERYLSAVDSCRLSIPRADNRYDWLK
jgi:hypothetical protein